eukprot:7381805-Prymnesium_polylepis.2
MHAGRPRVGRRKHCRDWWVHGYMCGTGARCDCRASWVHGCMCGTGARGLILCRAASCEHDPDLRKDGCVVENRPLRVRRAGPQATRWPVAA